MTDTDAPTDRLTVTSLRVSDYREAWLEQACRGRGYQHMYVEDWPVPPDVDGTELGAPLVSFQRPRYVATIHEVDGGYAHLSVGNGTLTVEGYAGSPLRAAQIVTEVRTIIPRGANPNPDVVPVTFWTYGPHGPCSIRRDLDAPTWTSIAPNYTAKTADGVSRLMDPSFRPGVGGQLVLWQGDPGTGKTTALRALAREWRDWCDMHYVVDPEHFFGSHADYMMNVLMGDSGYPDDEAGDDRMRWRLLLLEDCGELLQPDAKREVGQALARLLNACDGLIGRGLRMMVLVTTNEPIDKLHDAVSRPGRCASRVEFEAFSASEARVWLTEHGYEGDPGFLPRTLADLYGTVEHFEDASARRGQPLGFR